MYVDYWHLKEKPFENTPDPKFFYNSSHHEEAFARMIYVVKEGKGAGMLTGIFGCGKTVLSRALYVELERSMCKVAIITNPRLNDVGLLRMICHQLGKTSVPNEKADVLMALEDMLKNNMRDGKKSVIVIDEAHLIEDIHIFEEIRLLLNYQENNKFLLTLILMGQPELKEKVESNKQLLQRIAIRYHLEGLNEEETAHYIEHRLKVAQGSGIFTPAAMKVVYEQSGGIPRRINQICDMCLFAAFGRHITSITDDIVREAVESLEK
jgi:general secretion pathway protein A